MCLKDGKNNTLRMKIGFVGLGKLGLPVALAIEDKGHTVLGYDIDPNVKKILEKKKNSI